MESESAKQPCSTRAGDCNVTTTDICTNNTVNTSPLVPAATTTQHGLDNDMATTEPQTNPPQDNNNTNQSVIVGFGQTVFETEYILTRYKNLRCFPNCGLVHKERHFCGCPVTFTVHLPNDIRVTDLYVYGEFRSHDSIAKFNVGSDCTFGHSPLPQELKNDNHFPAALLQVRRGHGIFSIYPPRKWRCDFDNVAALPLGSAKNYMFSVYVINTIVQKCIGLLDSSVFKLSLGHVKGESEDVSSSSSSIPHLLVRPPSSASSSSSTPLKQQRLRTNHHHRGDKHHHRDNDHDKKNSHDVLVQHKRTRQDTIPYQQIPGINEIPPMTHIPIGGIPYGSSGGGGYSQQLPIFPPQQMMGNGGGGMPQFTPLMVPPMAAPPQYLTFHGGGANNGAGHVSHQTPIPIPFAPLNSFMPTTAGGPYLTLLPLPPPPPPFVPSPGMQPITYPMIGGNGGMFPMSMAHPQQVFRPPPQLFPNVVGGNDMFTGGFSGGSIGGDGSSSRPAT